MKTALLLVLALGSQTAMAQDEGGSKKKARAKQGDAVREIERGLYLKAGAGSNQYLGVITGVSGLIRPVVAMNIAVGQDFVDKEKSSIAWEASFNQALHNGPKFDELSALPPIVQGDIHTFSGMVFIEASGYVTRRFGIGIRGGAGITSVPVLMEPTAYANDVEAGSWGQASAVHAGPLPTFGGGPTIEYYTKLSHFSVGIDADVLFVLNLDLAIAPVGYLKYTF